MHWEPPESENELVSPYESNVASWREGVGYVFTIERLSDESSVGRICIRQIEGAIWDFGFWTHPKFQGQGYMTEAVRALMDFGFRKLDISEFHAAYATWNTASKRVLEKVGFQFLRHDSNVHIKNGRQVDEDVLSIEREHWEKLAEQVAADQPLTT